MTVRDQGGLFILCGIDGAGKSTALERIAAERPEWEVGSYDPRSWLPQPELPHLDVLLECHPRDVLSRMEPVTGAVFLAQLVLAHYEHWLAPRLAAGAVVLLDSYHYRFHAKLAARHRAHTVFTDALLPLPRPELALLLEVDPREAARRKQQFDEHEYFEEPEEADFVRFQTAVWSRVRELCAADCRGTVALDGGRAPEQVARDVVAAIEERS